MMQESVERALHDQTKLEMDEATFEILNDLLDYHYSIRLKVTRASVGDKIVAVMTTENGEGN